MDYIPIEELKNGYLYRIRARNGAFGIWKQKHNAFVIARVKFGHNYIFDEYHWDTGPPHGTVKPLKEIEQCPFNVNDLYDQEEDLLDYLNGYEIPYETDRVIQLGFTVEEVLADKPDFDLTVRLKRQKERECALS